MIQRTDASGAAAYVGGVDEMSSTALLLDGCGCLIAEEHLTRCVLAPPPAGAVIAGPSPALTASAADLRRAKARAKMTAWRKANPERWREIQRKSYQRRKAA